MKDQSIIATTTETHPVTWRSRKSIKTLALYLTMVTVSTFTIYLLEHSSLFSALRTAMVAALAKTFAASWVVGIFE